MWYLANDDGQGLVEYALLIALLAIVVAAIISVYGQQLEALFLQIVQCLPEPGPFCPN